MYEEKKGEQEVATKQNQKLHRDRLGSRRVSRTNNEQARPHTSGARKGQGGEKDRKPEKKGKTSEKDGSSSEYPAAQGAVAHVPRIIPSDRGGKGMYCKRTRGVRISQPKSSGKKRATKTKGENTVTV